MKVNKLSVAATFFSVFLFALGPLGVMNAKAADAPATCQEAADQKLGAGKTAADCYTDEKECNEMGVKPFSTPKELCSGVCCYRTLGAPTTCQEAADQKFGAGKTAADCYTDEKNCKEMGVTLFSTPKELCSGVCCYRTLKGAAGAAAGSPVTLTNPLGAGSSFYTIISKLITAFLGMVGGLALLVFVYAGIMWMTAGSSDRVQKAKDAMKYAVIGLALIGFSYVITTFVISGLTGGVKPAQEKTPEYTTAPGPNE